MLKYSGAQPDSARSGSVTAVERDSGRAGFMPHGLKPRRR